VLADAASTPADVKGVVLVGGSTRVPLVRASVAELVRQARRWPTSIPTRSWRSGAALQAEALTQGSDTCCST
jgi:molecular chaperone HscA